MTSTRLAWTAAALLLGSSACGDPDTPTAPADLTCEAAPASTARDAVALYLDGLNEPDADARPCLFQRALADDAVVLSHSGEAEGRAAARVALDAEAEARAQDVEVRELIGEPLFRHQEALVQWVVRDADGRELERGDDWIEVADDGRIAAVHTLGEATGEITVTEALRAWEQAWNSRVAEEQRDALEQATTENIRFSDLLVDVRGRDALLAEIQRQQGLLDGTLDLGERFEVHVDEGGTARLLRHRATIRGSGGLDVEVVNFIRLREGRIERLAGFPVDSLSED